MNGNEGQQGPVDGQQGPVGDQQGAAGQQVPAAGQDPTAGQTPAATGGQQGQAPVGGQQGPIAGPPPSQPQHGQAQPHHSQAQQPGQPLYGQGAQPQTGQPQYGQGGQAQYGQGQPQYGQPGQAQYGVFGQGPQWQQGYGQWGYQPVPPAPKRSKRLPALIGVLSLLAVAAIGSVAWGIDQRAGGNSSALSSSMDASAVAAKLSPGLVDVNTTLGYEGARAAGTGIVLTSDGEILTNHHVIEGATKISVTDIGNGKTYEASVVGYDDSHDIAVLKLKDASGLEVAKTGDSSKVAIGDQVVGIGNAGGVGGTPSYAAGKVTGLNQAITATDESGSDPENLTGLIQTDANIQAGDSGGPLANSKGEVIGVDTAGGSGNSGNGNRPGQTAYGSSSSSAALTAYGDGPGSGLGDGSGGFGNGQGSGGFGDGQGFGNGEGNGQDGQGQQTTTQGYAIPINQALDIANQIESGKASADIHIGDSAMLGISVLANGGVSGAVVNDVVSGGAADKAGITAGSVITSFDGKSVDSPDALSTLLNPHHAGDKVPVTWQDQSGQSHTATITLIAGPVR